MYVILLAIMVFISAALAGIFAPPFQTATVETAKPVGYTCCNTGDGADCKPDPSGGTISYNGKSYQLLKSNVYLKNMSSIEHYDYAMDAGARVKLNDEYVLLNVIPEKNTERGKTHPPNCLKPAPDKGFDWIYVKKEESDNSGNEFSCERIPDDLLLYLCRKDNIAGKCEDGELNKKNVALDVWIRTDDVKNTTISEKFPFLAKCNKPDSPKIVDKQQIVFRPSPGGQNNLQLRTFSFSEPASEAEWLNPYCKPAIYLYPEKKTEVNVSVFPKGKMLLTIPEYPKLGWDIVAERNGDITYQNTRYDYLYYEASIPDKLISKPDKGYVIPYDEREAFLKKLVVDLGLNEKETKQFVEYWVPILPKSPYYFIGIVPVSNLNEISPVLITPRPTNFLRVTLYFQALNERQTVEPPVIAPFSRDGFTAVEWGGLFKRDKDHPFTCFM